jgi:DNA-binding MarR family transcriptional regulator
MRGRLRQRSNQTKKTTNWNLPMNDPNKKATGPALTGPATITNESQQQPTRQTQPGKPFVPGWLDDAGLSQAEFRLYCHLCRRADNRTGIAWPDADSIAKVCQMARNTVWSSLRRLEERGLIERLPKPFAGSNRYKIHAVAIGANEIPNGNPIGANNIPIEGLPIGANESRQSAQMDSHQSAQMDSHKGTPKKVLHERVSNKTLFSTAEILPFNSEAFREAWDSWKRHLSQKPKAKRPTAEAMASQLKKLARMGEKAATAALLYSTANSYQGVYPDPQHIPETGRPASFDELKSHAEKNGVAVAIAEKYWDTRERVGWTMRGSVMTDWKADFRAFADDWNRNEQRQSK